MTAHVSRREFLIRTGLVVFASALIPKTVLMLSDDSGPSKADLSELTDFIKMLYHELSTYPKGSVAHSVQEIELYRDPELLGDLVSGISISDNREFSLVFKFHLGHENIFINDLEFRRVAVDNIVETLRIEWKKRNKRWGVSRDSYWYDKLA